MPDHPQPAPNVLWSNRIILVLLLAVLLPVAVSVLYLFPPTQYSVLPCIFHYFTGLHCPGCGATRCVHALLTGDVPQAFAYNPLFLLLSPLLLWEGCKITYWLWTGKSIRGPRLPAWSA